MNLTEFKNALSSDATKKCEEYEKVISELRSELEAAKERIEFLEDTK